MVVNDDGITSRGLRELVDALLPRANVFVCAPDEQHSGASQSLTLFDPIRVYDFDYPGAEAAYAVTGTPTDCTKVGLQFYRERGVEMDLVYSGINIGSNFGKDTLYSGTIGAAMEAALSNVRAIAVSVDSHSATHFETAREVAVSVIDKVLMELTPDTILNINAPDIPPEEVRGIRYTALGNRFYIDKFIPVPSEEGDSYMLDGAPLDLHDIEEKYDVTATWDNYVSITPLQFDYTAYDMISKISSWGLALTRGKISKGSDADKADDAEAGSNAASPEETAGSDAGTTEETAGSNAASPEETKGSEIAAASDHDRMPE